jgi:hypothetical protein
MDGFMNQFMPQDCVDRIIEKFKKLQEERMIKYESKIYALERIYNYLFGDRLEPSPEERIKIKFKLEKVIELLRDLNRKESIKKEKPKLKVGDTVEILGNTVVIEDIVAGGRAHCMCLDDEGRFQRLSISYDFLMTMKGWKI